MPACARLSSSAETCSADHVHAGPSQSFPSGPPADGTGRISFCSVAGGPAYVIIGVRPMVRSRDSAKGGVHAMTSVSAGVTAAEGHGEPGQPTFCSRRLPIAERPASVLPPWRCFLVRTAQASTGCKRGSTQRFAGEHASSREVRETSRRPALADPGAPTGRRARGFSFPPSSAHPSDLVVFPVFSG